jgi:NADPH:quinone reductase-like Zn-dependent oxidoreductase
METIKTFERIIINRYGDPEVLQSEKIELIPDKSKGLLIEVWAIGVGFADIMAQRGGYILGPKLPFSPGYDFVGKVINAYNSSNFCEGDFVAALLPKMGTYRDIIEVKEELLVKLPDGSSIMKSAAAVLNYLTAYCILEKKANIKQGDTVLIQGASGGVGIALAQIGQLKKLNMYGTASKTKHGLLKEMGVTPIDYRNEDFVRIIKNKFPGGIDAAFDAIGGKNLARSAKVVKKGGIIVIYGFSGNNYGGYGELIKGLWLLIRLNLAPNGKKIKICRTPSEVKRNPQWYRKTLRRIFEEINESKLNPLIATCFPLSKASKAHALIEGGNLKGKVVLKTKYFIE